MNRREYQAFETATNLAMVAGTGVTLKAHEANWIVERIHALRLAIAEHIWNPDCHHESFVGDFWGTCESNVDCPYSALCKVLQGGD